MGNIKDVRELIRVIEIQFLITGQSMLLFLLKV